MENTSFSAYYKAQNIIPDDEWEPFMEALRTHLPTTFRVAGSRQCVLGLCSRSLDLMRHRIAHTLNEIIKNTYVPTLSDAVYEGQKIPPPVQIPW